VASSASMHAGKPWRDVVHIADNTGPRGGRYWTLTLECGHHAFRPVPVIAPDKMAAVFGRVRTAPHRVRCYFCPGEVPRG
jgi:hypothetical protein